MKHATSRLLFAYWDALRGERSAPERSEVEPGRIRHILADTFLLAAERSGEATFRLAGTRCNALFGRDLHEAPFESLWGSDATDEPRRLVAAVASGMAGIVFGALASTRDERFVPIEVLLLPLRHAGRGPSRLIGALSPVTVPDWLGTAPAVRLRTTSLRVIGSEGRADPGERRFATGPRRPFVVHEGGRTDAERSRL